MMRLLSPTEGRVPTDCSPSALGEAYPQLGPQPPTAEQGGVVGKLEVGILQVHGTDQTDRQTGTEVTRTSG